jgi:hypothetical protein
LICIHIVVRVHGTEIRMFVVLLQSDRLAGSQVGKWTVHTTPPKGRHGSATLNFFIFARHSCRHSPPLPPSPSAPVIASAILRRHSCLECPRNKQTNKNFGSSRNKPKQDMFRFCFGLFRETKNKKFGFVSVSFGVSNLYRNNRNKQNFFETIPNNPKQP